MSLRDQPYLPLYVQDFLTDEKLAECSAKANGVYIRLMCLMHKSEIYGKILLKQKDKQTLNQVENFAIKIAKHFPYDYTTVFNALTELVNEAVLTIEGDFLVQKRMVKDADISEKRAASGSKGGKKTTKKICSSKKSSKIEANSEYEYEYENDIKVLEFNNIKVSNAEHKKLIADYGEQKTLSAYQYLSDYKIEKGYKTKSDYRTIRRWVIEAVGKRTQTSSHKQMVD